MDTFSPVSLFQATPHTTPAIIRKPEIQAAIRRILACRGTSAHIIKVAGPIPIPGLCLQWLGILIREEGTVSLPCDYIVGVDGFEMSVRIVPESR
jgi:hypothetical protein